MEPTTTVCPPVAGPERHSRIFITTQNSDLISFVKLGPVPFEWNGPSPLECVRTVSASDFVEKLREIVCFWREALSPVFLQDVKILDEQRFQVSDFSAHIFHRSAARVSL